MLQMMVDYYLVVVACRIHGQISVLTLQVILDLGIYLQLLEIVEVDIILFLHNQ